MSSEFQLLSKKVMRILKTIILRNGEYSRSIREAVSIMMGKAITPSVSL